MSIEHFCKIDHKYDILDIPIIVLKNRPANESDWNGDRLKIRLEEIRKSRELYKSKSIY